MLMQEQYKNKNGMNVYRAFEETDFESVKKLYRNSFNIEISREIYDYFYKGNQGYVSSVVEIDGNVVGHNAFIHREYFWKGNKRTIALSSGGMVDSNYSGVFFNLLKKQINNFQGDFIIAFPNGNSAPFFKKLFKFCILEQNYYTLESTKFTPTGDVVSCFFQRDDNFFEKRIEQHPFHQYKRVFESGRFFVYKEYIGTIDIIYSSSFNNFFERQIQELIDKGYKKFNIIHWDEKYITKLGFKPQKNNIFAYKSVNKALQESVFECQMVDSDVF